MLLVYNNEAKYELLHSSESGAYEHSMYITCHSVIIARQ